MHFSSSRLLARACLAGGGLAGGHLLVPSRPVEAHSTKATIAPFQSLDESKAQLKLVQVVFRHGARTPLSRDPSIWQKLGVKWDVCDCYKATLPLALFTTDGAPAQPNAHNLSQVNRKLEGNCHVGQLTRHGQGQALDLGQWLRQRYVQQLKFLKPTYEEGVLQSRTTNFQRTIATLAGVLTGLLGEEAAQQLKRPIPVITSTDFDEILFGDSKTCPYLKLYMKMGKDVAKMLVATDPEHDWARAELERLGHLPPLTPDNANFPTFADVYDVVAALQAGEKPLPPGLTPELIKVINRLATKAFAPKVAPSLTVEHAQATLKLSMGVLLDMLVKNMEHTLSGADSPQVYLYSGHDSTILPLLSAMGIDTLSSWPPFLSNLVFELWQLPAEQGGQHVVRVLYNRQELEIPHCPPGMYATLETFKHEVIGPFLITQAELSEACHVPIDHDTLSHMRDLPAESLSAAV